MSFLTGSRAYGTTHESSDIDLVVLLTKEEIVALERVSGESEEDIEETEKYAGSAGFRRSIRFGDLNLICVSCPDEFRVWEEGTDALKVRAPVTRDQAIEEFTRRRAVLAARNRLDRPEVAAAASS